jgi:hypothetical protein
MLTLEQAASPVTGFWQVRQLSVHSRQVASGGAKIAAGAGACSGSAGLGSAGRSAANAAAGQIATAAAMHQEIRRLVMVSNLPG